MDDTALPKNNSLLSTGSSLHWRGLTVNLPHQPRHNRRSDATAGTDLEYGVLHSPDKQNILTDISGFVHPGQLLFIMGPSGSGKTTLLDALASRCCQGVSGVQYLDGRPKTDRALRSVAKYVEQTDDLIGVLSVKETLDFYAGLYIAESSARTSAVVDVLDILGLTAHAHTKIGNAFVRGLSSGQIRRVSIGAELVASPNLLFLDECTSGLDSATAYHVMSELKRIAQSTAMAMIVTVHQPSQLIFEMADNLLLLSKGQTVYFGPAHAAVDHFVSLGFSPTPRVSDVEWMLDLVNPYFGQHDAVERCIRAWPSTPPAFSLSKVLDDKDVPNPMATTTNINSASNSNNKNNNSNNTTNEDTSSANTMMRRRATSEHEHPPALTDATNHNTTSDDDDQESTRKRVSTARRRVFSAYNVGFFQQTAVLTRRGILNSLRNPAVLWLRFAMYMMLSLMIGLVWLRLGSSAKYIIDINNALFYVCAFMIFMSVSVLPAYLEERAILCRERASGAYSVAAYIVSHTLYEIPYVLILSLSASTVTYFMVGLRPTMKAFWIFTANLFLTLMVSESIMVLIAAVIPILIVGVAAGAMTFGLFMCVQGAFISIDQIGWWLRWVVYIALHYYSYSTFLVNQHRGQVYAAAPDHVFPAYPEDVRGETVYREMGLEDRIWVNFAAQAAMVVVYRALAALWLHMFVKGKR